MISFHDYYFVVVAVIRKMLCNEVTLFYGHANKAHCCCCCCLASRFIKEVFESRPALPKYSETWDVKQVFSYLQTLHPPESLTLKDLTHKLVMLLALLSEQRRQTLRSLSVSDMKLSPNKCVFVVKTSLKDFQVWQAHCQPEVCRLSTRSSVVCCYLHTRMC